jgi:hypothetical protein
MDTGFLSGDIKLPNFGRIRFRKIDNAIGVILASLDAWAGGLCEFGSTRLKKIWNLP